MEQQARRPRRAVRRWWTVIAAGAVLCGRCAARAAPTCNALAALRGGAMSGTKQEQREALYEAYNMLHTLAQDFRKPFDSPAVLVVGHQSSGKSALIEALMGFQFNQVGGGTKTRRPIALRMQYSPECDQPRCWLTLDNGREEPRSLPEIQEYIESENRRLERDPMRCFDPREIMIRMEYRFCPNMILIDTPGLIQAPRGKHLNTEQRQLLQAAREAENLVLQKMRCQDYVILCVEDTADWKHATTRNIVMKADPGLERTVLVTTKLDTKVPQFGTANDLEDFLAAPILRRMYTGMLGGPFFTTVPAGRVGRGREAAYTSNEAFVRGVRRGERDDQGTIAARLGPQAAEAVLPRIGVSRLRRFLERRVEECYRRNVARIVPLLQRELRRAEGRLVDTERDLEALSIERLKSAADEYREHFVRALGSAIQGTIKAPPEAYGETLVAEQLKAGTFVEEGEVDRERWDRLMEVEVGNGHHRLYGGAQYHRALREFAFAVRHMVAPSVTEDEIANAAGVGDMHDGVNFMRAACVIAVEKARVGFEPLLDALRLRTVHVMKRLFAVVDYMLSREGTAMSEPHQKPFSFVVRRIFENFVEASVDSCLGRCRDDLRAITRFVTWDLHERAAGALQRSLPDTSMVQVYALAVDSSRRARQQRRKALAGDNGARRANAAESEGAAEEGSVVDQWEAANTGGLGGAGSLTQQREYLDLMQLMEEAACTRNAQRTSAVVQALVQHIMLSWREHFARAVAMKFNCFFLMPFVDEFPAYLRQQLDRVYEGDISDLFDIAEARAALVRKREELVAECKACHEIQSKFDLINMQLNSAKTIYGEEYTFAADNEPIVEDEDELPQHAAAGEDSAYDWSGAEAAEADDLDDISSFEDFKDVGDYAPPAAGAAVAGGSGKSGGLPSGATGVRTTTAKPSGYGVRYTTPPDVDDDDVVVNALQYSDLTGATAAASSASSPAAARQERRDGSGGGGRNSTVPTERAGRRRSAAAAAAGP